MPPRRVELVSAAEHDLVRLSPALRERVTERLADLAEDPRPAGSLKLSGSDGRYRLRVGDYRILYLVNDRLGIVYVTHIRHRRDVYRRLG